MPLPPPADLSAVPAVELALATRLLETGRFRQAVSALRPLAAQHPDDPDVARGLGRALAGAGWCREALDWLERARTDARYTATDAWYEGTCRESLGDDAGAVAALEEALLLDPWHARSLASLAMLGDRMGEPALAERARARLWTLPEGWLLVWLADTRQAVLSRSPEADRALALLQPLRGSDPAIRREWHLLDGQLALWEGAPDYAARTLSEAVRADPRDPEAAAWHADALRQAGDAVAARAALARPWVALRDPTVALLAVEAAVEAALEAEP